MNAYETLPAAAAGSRKARIEIIPLIDVIFFLLATFVLFTLSLQRISTLETNFAQASTQEKTNEPGLTVQATAEGMVAWTLGSTSPEVITGSELRPRLAEYRRSAPAPRVMIRGEGGRSWEPSCH